MAFGGHSNILKSNDFFTRDQTQTIRGFFIENQTFDVLDVSWIEIAVMVDSSNIVVFI